MATTFYAFRRTVTTSGTPVQLDTFSVEADQSVLIKASTTNTGVISIGNSSAEAIKTNAENFLLAAGQSVELKVPNTNEVWIDSTISGDIVEVVVGGGGGSSGGGSGSSTSTGPAADNAAASGNPVRAAGKYNSSLQTYADGDVADMQTDVNGNLKTREQYSPGYEDNTANKAVVEHRYSFTLLAADGQVKSGAGLLHTLTFSCNDAAPTAGSIIVYDSLTETGTQIFNHTFTTTPFAPFSVLIDASFATGLYVGFTTTNDVNVTVSYR